MSKGWLAAQLLLRLLLLFLLMGVLLYWPAGTLQYRQAWVYLGVFILPALFISLYFLARDPELIERRLRWREQERQQRIGQGLLVVFGAVGLVIAGVDFRYGWSHVPAALAWVADAIVFGAFALIFLAFQANRYAGGTVEVEAGQQVISSGPYAVVRHPMYLGALLMILLTSFALGSYWALLAFLPMGFGIILRTRNEEMMLLRELPGYADYSRKVHWRLLPGVW